MKARDSVRYSIAWRADRNCWQVTLTQAGKRKRKSGFAARDEAVAYAVECQRKACLELSSPHAAKAGEIQTIRDLVGATYDAYWKHQRAGDDALSNAEDVMKILGPNEPVTNLTSAECLRVFKELCTRQIQPATVNRKMSALGRMVSHALDCEVIEKRPKIRKLQEDNVREDFLSEEDERKLFDVLREIAPEEGAVKYLDLYMFLLDTGARVNEALKLEWRHIMDGHSVRFERTKTRKSRVVPLSKRAAEVLARRKADGCESPFGAVSYRAALELFKATAEAAGLSDGLVLHSLRHSYATRLAMRGVPINVIAEVLGHSSMLMSARYMKYAPSGLDLVRKALD